MPRRATIDYAEVIEKILAAHPEGVTPQALLTESALSIDRSTLHRHMAALLLARRVERIGAGRASRYRLLGIPRIRAHLLTPYTQRAPARYRREFLDRYLPNRTPYLSAQDLDRLYRAGRVSMGPAPVGTYARRVYERFMVDLSYASSKLEGNTYSLLETERLLKFGEESSGKDRKETVMILNHKEAIRFLVDNIAAIDLTRRDLLDIHALLSNGLLAEPAYSGRLRRSVVKIAGSAYTPLDNPFQIEEEFDVLLAKLAVIENPFEKALCLIVFLPYLQAFEDVNKRTSRVAANIALLKHDLCPLSFMTVDEKDYVDGTLGVYELNDVSLLKHAFVEGYVRSADNYRYVRAEVDEVSVGALEYRPQVRDAVRKCVREWRAFDEERLRAHLAGKVKPEHLAEVVAVVKRELMGLHEGNLVRFQLSPTDLRDFKPPIPTL